jgi:hypothetical protein
VLYSSIASTCGLSHCKAVLVMQSHLYVQLQEKATTYSDMKAAAAECTWLSLYEPINLQVRSQTLLALTE